MRVCQLDGKEAKLLEKCGVRPDCGSHPHLRNEEASRLVASRAFRYVGHKQRCITRFGDGTAAFYDRVDCSKRAWAVKRSDPVVPFRLQTNARRLGRR